MRKHVLIAAAISIALCALALVWARPTGSPQARERPNVRADTLRTKAKREGKAVAAAQPTNLRRYNDVGTITRESNTIVVGVVASKASQLLPPAEKFIVTDFQVNVQTVLKGGLALGSAITVRTSGGRVDFGDGTWAEVTMPDFWKYPEVGKRYVMFLENRTNGTFVLRGGPQGLFHINDYGQIQPQVRAEDELMRNYADKNLSLVLQEIHRAGK